MGNHPFLLLTMNEKRIYHYCMISGTVIVLAGIGFHSWKAVAMGALIAGAGGLFSVFVARQ